MAQSLPSITQHPENATVRQGSDHILHCAATGGKPRAQSCENTNLTWFVDGITIRWSHNGHIIVADSGRQIQLDNSLRIRMVDSSTVGQYACRASNSLGYTVTSKQAHIQLACKSYTKVL